MVGKKKSGFAEEKTLLLIKKSIYLPVTFNIDLFNCRTNETVFRGNVFSISDFLIAERNRFSDFL